MTKMNGIQLGATGVFGMLVAPRLIRSSFYACRPLSTILVPKEQLALKIRLHFRLYF